MWLFRKTTTLFFVVFVSFFVSKFSEARVLETVSSYVVSGVRISTDIQDYEKAKEDLDKKARAAAFAYIRLYLNKSEVPIEHVDTRDFILEFSPISIFPHDDGFVGVFEIVFDRAAINSFLSIQEVHNFAEEAHQFKVSTREGLTLWMKVKSSLQKSKLNYQVTLIESGFVEISVFKVSIEKIEEYFVRYGLEVVKNRQLYFIKPINVYDDR